MAEYKCYFGSYYETNNYSPWILSNKLHELRQKLAPTCPDLAPLVLFSPLDAPLPPLLPPMPMPAMGPAAILDLDRKNKREIKSADDAWLIIPSFGWMMKSNGKVEEKTLRKNIDDIKAQIDNIRSITFWMEQFATGLIERAPCDLTKSEAYQIVAFGRDTWTTCIGEPHMIEFFKNEIQDVDLHSFL